MNKVQKAFNSLTTGNTVALVAIKRDKKNRLRGYMMINTKKKKEIIETVMLIDSQANAIRTELQRLGVLHDGGKTMYR